MTLDEYKAAEKDLDVRQSKLGWRIHATVYAIVNAGLIVLNYLLVAYTDETFYWFPFPLVMWGIGLSIHYYFGYRRAEQEVEKHQYEVERTAGQYRQTG